MGLFSSETVDMSLSGKENKMEWNSFFFFISCSIVLYEAYWSQFPTPKAEKGEKEFSLLVPDFPPTTRVGGRARGQLIRALFYPLARYLQFGVEI